MNNYMIPLLLVLAVIIFSVGFVHIMEWWDRKKSDDGHREAANNTAYEEILDRHFGKKGTPARDAFEADMQALKRRFENNEDGYPVEIPNKDVLAGELQERLVQTCLDFIKEKGDKYIWRVEFTADSLQESAEDGRWMPCTDSFIELEGLVWDPEIKAVVRKEIGSCG